MSAVAYRTQPPRAISERLLLAFSKRPGSGEYEAGQDHWTPGDSVSHLRQFFPDFAGRIAGRRVLDFGCGRGYQSVDFARMGAAHVVGLDINRQYLHEGRRMAAEAGLADVVEFTETLEYCQNFQFDVVVSQNGMEHYKEPAQALGDMKALLKPGGLIFITFGPPWFAPYGSHMHFFTRLPWANIIFSEKTVMGVRAYYRNDGASRYEDVEGGLNKMSLKKFGQTIRDSRVHIESMRYDCIRGMNFLARLPLLRELFVNNVSCVLRKD